jgi:predicted permease
MLVKNPGFTATAVACLALGIGATTAIFSVVNAVLLKPLPYRDSQRLGRVYTEFPAFHNGGLLRLALAPPELVELRRGTNSWKAIEGWEVGGATLAGGHEPVRATVAYVTGGMLRMLGVAPVMGRLLSNEDDQRGAPLNAVISFELWQRVYGGDPNILGRDIRHDGNPCTVVGVMPKGFEFPPGEPDRADVWVPIEMDLAQETQRGNHSLNVIGRLRDGVTFETARGEMQAFVEATARAAAPVSHRLSPNEHTLLVAGFRDEVVRNVRLAMLVLLGAVAFVLLISSVNVANLLLARAEGRRREIAIRKAVGASAGSMVAQFVVEGVALSLVGAAVALALGYGGMRLIAQLNAGTVPRTGEIVLDRWVLLFTMTVSVFTGVAFGLAPAMHLIGQNPFQQLKASAGRVTGHAAANQFRAALAATELALALVLLIGTGLMVKTFWKLQAVDAGIASGHLATLRVTLPEGLYSKAPRRAAFWRDVESSVAAIPGVQSAAVATFIPPVEYLLASTTTIEGYVRKPGGPQENVDYWNAVGPRYFETLGVRLIEGRTFDANDGLTSPQVVMVNQTMARMFWGQQSAVGRRVKPWGRGNWRTVVGVVADVKNAGLDRPTGTELYFPEPQGSVFGGDTTVTLLVRGADSQDPMRLMPMVQQRIRALDPTAAISAVRSMDEVLDAARSRPRFIAVVLTLFSLVSLALAALGIYGVMSYAVAQRTTEIGVRMALGAQSRDVLAMVLRSGLSIALAGTLLGAVGAFALTRLMRGLLFGVPAFDASTFLGMAAVLIAVTLAACYLPARRVARTDPMVALRYE